MITVIVTETAKNNSIFNTVATPRVTSTQEAYDTIDFFKKWYCKVGFKVTLSNLHQCILYNKETEEYIFIQSVIIPKTVLDSWK